MHRRRFLQASAAGALAALAPMSEVSAQMMGRMGTMGRTPTTPAWPVGLPLRALDLLPNASATPGVFEGSIVASSFAASLVTGATTSLWGYNGASPGPVIEWREGDRVAIQFSNRLALDSTVHWHGLAVPPAEDGNPMDPVAPGADRVYAFEVPRGSAGTYWYHPHAHGTTTLQVGQGLAAPLIVRAADDPLAALPEVTLMVSSLTLTGTGQVARPYVPPGGMSMGGTMTGGTATTGVTEVLVNGRKQPAHRVAPGATQRWRILNATPDRTLRLSLDGHRFAVVGTDGGLLPQPLANLSEWLLAPAQRIEIVVTISTQPGARFTLRDLGYSGGMMGGMMGGMTGGGVALMTVETTNAAALAPVALPASLRPVADLGAAAFRQQVVLSGGMGMTGGFLINGRAFDMNRVDFVSSVGRVELWDFVNATAMDHPMHIHGTQFQVVGGTASSLGAPYVGPAWFDTVNVPAGATVTIKTRQDLPGRRMVHCHILPHEDAGMMAVLDVRPA